MIQAAQFILGISLLIVLHEFGHFLPAKIFGTRVSKFYLFFDYKFSLFKKKIGETVYGIGWIPLGGYVKIEGMVDESMDTDGLQGEPEPWEFRAKPGWQRLIILTGGVFMNFLTAYVIYMGLLMNYGKDYLPNEVLTNGLWVQEQGLELGLQHGDKILAIGGSEIEDFGKIPTEILLSGGSNITVDRNGQIIELPIHSEAIAKMIQEKSFRRIVLPRLPYVVESFREGSTAEAAGLLAGDSIYALNGTEMAFFDQYKSAMKDYKGTAVNLSFVRDGEHMNLDIPVSEEGMIGAFVNMTFNNYYPIRTKKYTFSESFGGAWKELVDQLSFYVRQFKLIFDTDTGAYKDVGGFIGIAKMYDAQWDWSAFWNRTAFLSIMLGFLNILPIPALDGGHVVFTIAEMITGKKPSIKVLEYAQMAGFFLLLALVIFANGNDFYKLFQQWFG